MDNYHILEPIGEGSFGKVYKGRRKSTGQLVAMKFIVKRGKACISMLRQEIAILQVISYLMGLNPTLTTQPTLFPFHRNSTIAI